MTRNIYNQTGYIDNLIVNGSLDSNLIPSSDLTYTLGDSSYRFKGLYTGIIANTQNVYLNSSSFPSNYPLNITAVNNTNDLIMLWNDHTGTNRWVWQLFSSDGGVTFNDMDFTEVGVADGRLYLKHGGTVGINTTNPNSSYALDVNGSALVQGDLNVSGSGSGYSLQIVPNTVGNYAQWIQFISNNGTTPLWNLNYVNGGDMNLSDTTNDGRLYISRASKTVGINTTTPNTSYGLDVGTAGIYVGTGGITLGNSSVSGYTPTALQVYEEDSAFGIDWTGPFSVSQAQNVQFIIVGSQVTLQVPAFQASATTTGRITNAVTLPTRFIPGTTIVKPIDVYNNSTLTQGRIQIDTSGNIIIGTDINLSVFTSGGNAGWEGFTFTYTVL